MDPVTVNVEISDETGKLDPKRLRSAQRKVKGLVSRRRPVIVTVENGRTGSNYLDYARRYSKDVNDVKEGVRKTNGLLIIAALRAERVPTHAQPFGSARAAKTFLKGKIAAAVV
jgi:hypothetical protein